MKFAIIGCGSIGKIYLKTILKSGLATPENITIVERDILSKTTLTSAHPACKWQEKWINTPVDLLILAVKPQDFSVVKKSLHANIPPETLVVSVMAGIPVAQLEKELKHKRIVRAMPNSPVEFGFGMTAYCSSNSADVNDIRNAEKLFSSTGRTLYLEDETLMDAVTALSGSGPAYFFYIVKSMIEAGKDLGFSETDAATLVKQTMLGAFHQLNASSQNLDELIQTVASRGGTTEAALKIFSDHHLSDTIKEGIRKAKERGKTLANGEK